MVLENFYLTFFLDKQAYALSIVHIATVVRAVEITQLPNSSDIITGMINVHGELTPVLDLHKVFHKSTRDVKMSDVFIITNFLNRSIALWVDEVGEMFEYTDSRPTDLADTLTKQKFLKEVIKQADLVLLVPDIEKILNSHKEVEFSLTNLVDGGIT